MKAERLTKLLTFQLRPNVSAMLDVFVARVQSRMPVGARINSSQILRKLMRRTFQYGPRSLSWVDVGRKRDGLARQLRVRCTEEEYAYIVARADSEQIAYSQIIAALIVEAAHPDGNFPANPDHQPTRNQVSTP